MAQQGQEAAAGQAVVQKPAVVAPSQKDSQEVSLLISYLAGVRAFYMQAMPPDGRPAAEILKDLKALPKEKKLALRAYVLETGSRLTGKALDLMGEILPDDHREFLFQALEQRQWGSAAVPALVAMNDPRLVGPILDRVNTEYVQGLAPLVRPSDRAFLKAVRREHARKPTARTAYVLGNYGLLAEKEIRQISASGDKTLRAHVLLGLSESKDKASLPLLLELADISSDNEWPLIANRFVAEGNVHVDELLQWLDASPSKKQVAGFALARIKSDKGVSRVLARYQDEPFDNSFASEATRSSPTATRDFIVDRLAHGTRAQKLNALLLAHHLGSWAPVSAEDRSTILESVLAATHDADAEVRELASRRVVHYSGSEGDAAGLRALRRLVEMFRDPEPGVRSEAIVQACEFPSPDLLLLIKKIAADPREDARVRDSAERCARSLEGRLRNLAGTGHVPVFLKGRPGR